MDEHTARLKNIWRNMLQRCYNPKVPSYKLYGLRGIQVCDAWKASFSQFREDMTPGYSPKLTLDRIDNNSNYCKENCRWATMKEQSNNTRRNRWVVVNGEKMTASEAAVRYGVSKQLFHLRVYKMGWTPDKAATTPPDAKKQPTRERKSYVEVQGERMNLKQACEKYGISKMTVYSRIKRGLDIDAVFTTPKWTRTA